MKLALLRGLTGVVAATAICTLGYAGEQPAPEPRKGGGDASPTASKGEAALKEASGAGKHLYLFFYSEDNEATREVRKSFEATLAKLTDVAQYVALNKDAPEEKALVAKYRLEAAPMPLILVVAPNGVITQACIGRYLSEEDLRAGIASPAQQKVLKALQDKKLVLVCAYDKTVPADGPAMKGINEFRADARYAALTEVVRVDPTDAAEAGFMGQLGIDPKDASSRAVTLVLAPPRSLLKRFNGVVTKDGLLGALTSAGSG